jgi:hypothetical protein
MSNNRIWLFRILTLVGAGLFLYSWFQPWWTAYIELLQENAATIYPHAMIIGGAIRDYPHWIMGYEMPTWFFPLMWVYLAVCLGVLTYSLFTSDEDRLTLGKFNLSLPLVLVGFAGLAYIIFVAVFPIVVSIRAPEFYGTPLQGSVFVSMDENHESFVRTGLQMGYWLAVATGVFLLAIALLRTKIVGNPTLNVS